MGKRRSGSRGGVENVGGYNADGVPLSFTERERTILLLVAEGLSNREIAQELYLSPTTVKWYLEQIFRKLGARRRTQAVKMASELHLLDKEPPEQAVAPGISTPLTAFIGRDREAGEIAHLLNDPDVRLVTILGAGGIGKTRLAVEVTNGQGPSMPGPACFVALDTVRSLSGLIQAVASAIGFQFHGTSDLGRQLLLGLRNRKLLLVMDNVEHLTKAGMFITQMLTAAPHLKILATSRERLNLSAETIYPLHGLDYPRGSGRPEEYAAFLLFMRIARYSQSAFRPDNDDVNQICRICQLVEGVPLAIELAARWIHLLTPQQIAEEISQGINIFQTTRQDLPDRHRSMRAVFEHSWQLLSSEEQDAFQKLSVFRGGFDRAAADQVTGATLFLLSALVDKSLLMWVGADRFKFHDLVRQFALEKLQIDAEQYALTLREHCRYYASIMARWEKEFKEDMSALGTRILGFHDDYDNIMAGWRHALDVPLMAEIGKYVFNISLSFTTHGLTLEAEQSFIQALRLFETHNLPADAFDRLRVMTHYSWFLVYTGQVKQARHVLEDAWRFAEIAEHSDDADVGLLLALLGLVLYLDGEPDAGRERAKQGLTVCQTVEFQFGVWSCLSFLGEMESSDGNYEAAYDYQKKALSYSEERKSIFNLPHNLGLLGWVCCVSGKIEEGLACLRRGLTINRDILSIDPILYTIFGIAELYEQRAQHDIALELLAIILHHPQYGPSSPQQPFSGSMARALRSQLQSQFSTDYIDSTMERAQHGRLSSHYLNPHFIVTPELIDRLFELLDEVEKL